MQPQVSAAIADYLWSMTGPAIWVGDVARDWPWMARLAGRLEALLTGQGVARDAVVGLIARNRPHHCAVVAGQVAARRPTSMIYSAQSPAAMAADIRKLKAAAIIADAADWTGELLAAAAESGAAAIAISDSAEDPVKLLAGAGRAAESSRRLSDEVAFELLTSGTTGPPKRVPLSWAALDLVVGDSRAIYVSPDGEMRPSPPQILVNPLGNVSGVHYVVTPLAYGQPLALLEKFDVAAWVAAVERHKPTRTGLPPAGFRMVLEAGVPPAALQSLSTIGTGGGLLDPKLQAAFEDRFNLAILPAFGATEFGGVIANWTLELHRQFAGKKPGSAGRARPGVSLRIVDRSGFEPLPTGEIGLLEAITPRTGPDWIRTNDLASLDADGFLFLHGRTDQAINRGGFKIVPAHVEAVLREHPAVAEAVVFGIEDERLGQAPVAVVERRAPLTEEMLKAYSRERLLAYQAPVAFLVVDALPRNASMKIALPEVRALFEASR